MDEHDNLIEQLQREYQLETRERLARLQETILALEQNKSAEEVAELAAAGMRELHTIKGGAYTVGREDMGNIAHACETLLQLVSASDGEVRELDALLWGADLLGALLESPAGAATLSEAEVEKISEALAEGRCDDALTERLLLPGQMRGSGVGSGGGDASPVGGGGNGDVESEKHHDGAGDAQPPAAGGNGATPPDGPGSTDGAAQPPDGSGSAAPQTIRVTADTVDRLINQIGELLINRIGHDATIDDLFELERTIAARQSHWRQNRVMLRNHADASQLYEELEESSQFLANLLESVRDLAGRVRGRNTGLERATEELQGSIMEIRMLPAGTLFRRFPRAVRDLSRELAKPVELNLEGEDCRLDWVVLERLQDPLLHLIRNAVHHGLEAAEDREKHGKPSSGSVTLRAFVHGSSVVVEVEDDGVGLDYASIREKATRLGLLTSDRAASMSSRELTELLFHSGFSTAAELSGVSGRGVGLDVVKRNLEELGGTIEVRSEAGQGTCFSLKVPITLATFKGIVVKARGSYFAVPQTAVNRFIRFRPDDIYTLEGKDSIDVNQSPMALATLADVLGLPDLKSAAPPWYRALVVQSAEKQVALLVDDIVDEREMVVRNLGHYVKRVRHVAGATILSSGQVVPILNISDCVRTVVEGQAASVTQATALNESRGEQRRSILVVDDSITTRTLERNILESAGYRVGVAVDGKEAQDLLQRQRFDLVVSDIQMPRLDGLGLTRWIRSEPEYKQLPVVLVSSLDTESDRKAGLDVGADAYLGKRSFNQEALIETIERLL